MRVSREQAHAASLLQCREFSHAPVRGAASLPLAGNDEECRLHPHRVRTDGTATTSAHTCIYACARASAARAVARAAHSRTHSRRACGAGFHE